MSSPNRLVDTDRLMLILMQQLSAEQIEFVMAALAAADVGQDGSTFNPMGFRPSNQMR